MPFISFLLVVGASAAVNLEKLPIPNDAKAIIRSVHDAAKTRDYVTLKRLMVPEFTWSFGGDGDVDQAIDAWKHDAAAMRELARVTRLHCAFRTSTSIIQCPENAGVNYRAGFIKTENGWRMSYFVAGD